MKNYEVVIIIEPNLEEEKATKRLQNIIEEQGVTIGSLDVWGLRTLAYTIDKHEQGRYYVVNFQTDNQSVIKDINRELNIEESVIRFTIHVV